MAMYREALIIDPKSPHCGRTETFRPVRYANGCFALAERYPAKGRNKAERVIFNPDEAACAELVRMGSHVIWMEGELTKKRALLCDRDITFVV